MELQASYEEVVQELHGLEVEREVLLFQVDVLQDTLESVEELLAEAQREAGQARMVRSQTHALRPALSDARSQMHALTPTLSHPRFQTKLSHPRFQTLFSHCHFGLKESANGKLTEQVTVCAVHVILVYQRIYVVFAYTQVLVVFQ